MALDLNNPKQALGYVTVWAKGKLAAMLEQFDTQEGIAASGSLSIKTEDIDELCEYLKTLEPKNGYTRIDIALFFADSEKPGDFSGKLSQPYKKEGGSTGSTPALKQLRTL